MDAITRRGPNAVIEIESHGPVRLVRLNRPDALNATNAELHGELATVWADLDADPEARAIVLTGAGKAFSAGGDLGLISAMVDDLDLRAAIMEESRVLVSAMTSVRAPIIAAVNGPAVGLGCSLAGMCDLVVMEEHAYFADPHVSIGLVAADGGALTWPLLTGLLRAKEYLLLGDRIPAAEAERLGLANRVVPSGTSVEVAMGLAQRMAALPQQSLRETKALLQHLVHQLVGDILTTAVEVETASFDEPVFQANLARMRERQRPS